MHAQLIYTYTYTRVDTDMRARGCACVRTGILQAHIHTRARALFVIHESGDTF